MTMQLYSESSLIWHSLGQEIILGLVRMLEIVLNWKVCQIIKGILDYESIRLERIHCTIL